MESQRDRSESANKDRGNKGTPPKGRIHDLMVNTNKDMFTIERKNVPPRRSEVTKKDEEKIVENYK